MTDKEFKEKAFERAAQKKRERKIAIASGISSLAVTVIMITVGFSFFFSSANYSNGGTAAMNDASPSADWEKINSGEMTESSSGLETNASYIKTSDGRTYYLSDDDEKTAVNLVNSLTYESEEDDDVEKPKGEGQVIIYEIHIADKAFVFTTDGIILKGEEKEISEGKTELDDFVKAIIGKADL